MLLLQSGSSWLCRRTPPNAGLLLCCGSSWLRRLLFRAQLQFLVTCMVRWRTSKLLFVQGTV